MARLSPNAINKVVNQMEETEEQIVARLHAEAYARHYEANRPRRTAPKPESVDRHSFQGRHYDPLPESK
jgi:hypothetical protein